MRNIMKYIVATLVAVFALTACSNERALDHLDYEDHDLSYSEVRQLIDQDIYEQYDVTGVDVPEVNEAYDEDERVVLMFGNSITKKAQEEWVDKLYNRNLDPAEIRVRTTDYVNHSYEVTLNDNKATLYALGEIGETPDPKELLR